MTPKAIAVAAILSLGLIPVIDDAGADRRDDGERSKQRLTPYTLKSPYLKDPDSVKSYVAGTANFWRNAIDNTNGGYFAYISRDGSPTDTTRKEITHLSRAAFGLSRAFMLTGDTAYLNDARRALDFIYAHAWDDVNGRWFVDFTDTGDLINTTSNNRITIFFQHQALIGISATLQAEQRDVDRQHYDLGLGSLNANLWDERPGFEGYLNTANADWSNPRNRGYIATIHGLSAHNIVDYLLAQDDETKARLLVLADNLANRIAPRMDDPEVVFGFPEYHDTDWNIRATAAHHYNSLPGHILRAAWCLARAYFIEPKPEYKNTASRLIYEVLDYDLPGHEAYDHVNGAPFHGLRWDTGERPDDTKRWSAAEEAVLAGLSNWRLSGDTAFLQMADESLDFYMNHFVDPIYGEAYKSVSPTGDVLDDSKGDLHKSAWRSIELAYFVYLYGNLFYHERPVDLYYRFEAKDTPQSIRLYPLAIEDAKLKIDEVELDGQEFDGFDEDTRTLYLPPYTGGVFKVTFELDDDDDDD